MLMAFYGRHTARERGWATGDGKSYHITDSGQEIARR